MSDGTKIEWTDATVNAVNGCSVVSPGCTNCYAMRLAGTRMRDHPTRKGLTFDSKAGPVWNGEIRVNEKAMLEPLRWAKPRMCFWNAHGDLFHPAVPDEVIDRCFAIMALTPHHTHQVLTKRPARMRQYFEERWQGTPARQIDCGSAGILDIPTGGETGRRHQVEIACEVIIDDLGLADTRKPHLWTEDGSLKLSQWAWPLPNVWLGVSVEDQQRADERIPDLLATPAAVRWLSCEPLLGRVDVRQWLHDYGCSACGYGGVVDERCRDCGWHGSVVHQAGPCPDCGVILSDDYACPECGESDGEGDFGPTVSGSRLGLLDWIVVGGESGPGARPMHPAWARSLREQCAAAGVPFLFKQWGAWAPLDTGLPAWHGNAAWPDGSVGFGDAKDRGGDGEAMFLGTKAITGRLLDGVQHDGYPAGNAR